MKSYPHTYPASKKYFDKKYIVSCLKSSFASYSSLFFIQNYRFGFLFFLLSFYHLDVGIAGLWGITSLYLFDQIFIKNKDIFTESYLIYNSLLVSMGVGYIFKINFDIMLIISVLSINTYLLSLFLKNVLLKYQLPVLSIPFCIIMIVFFLAKDKYVNLLYTMTPNLLFPDINLQFFPGINIFLKCLGAIIFSPYQITGLGIFLIIFLWSRNMAFISILSFYVVYGIENFLTTPEWSQVTLYYSYNHILVAIGLCTIYMLPTLKSLFIMPIAVFLTVLINDSLLVLFQQYQLPVFTVSFNITILIILYALRSLQFKNFPTTFAKKPEHALDWSGLNSINYQYPVLIDLPMRDQTSIYQAFDDQWTHRGIWKYALDFVKINADGDTYQDDPKIKENYFCFDADVISPLDGVISEIQMNEDDNQIGSINTQNNWGNYICIYSYLGYYVFLCHLKQYSSQLKKGDYVKTGDLIAKCGNSGNSPQPHLHIHIQSNPYIGDHTIPFCLSAFTNKQKIQFHQIPLKDQNISNLSNKEISYFLPFHMDKHYTYQFKHNSDITNVNLTINLNQYSGKLYLQDDDQNKLYFTRHTNYVSLDYYEGKTPSLLSFLHSSLPFLPYSFYPNYSWSRPISYRISETKIKTFLSFVFSFFRPNFKYHFNQSKFGGSPFQIIFQSKYLGKKIDGTIYFDQYGNIHEIKSDSYSLHKIGGDIE
jgi:urea transporter